VRALEDDAVVDFESKYVRAAGQVDTSDVRVLAIVLKQADSRSVPCPMLGRAWPERSMHRLEHSRLRDLCRISPDRFDHLGRAVLQLS